MALGEEFDGEYLGRVDVYRCDRFPDFRYHHHLSRRLGLFRPLRTQGGFAGVSLRATAETGVGNGFALGGRPGYIAALRAILPVGGERSHLHYPRIFPRHQSRTRSQ